MRVVECDTCGETISAADDDELAGRLKDHMASEHDVDMSEDDARQTVDVEAYDATDS
jgi:predicted small metal-binding protein